jgi:hypothetical protein
MKWEDSIEFLKSLNPYWRSRYDQLRYRYLNMPVDGHEAHISACDLVEKEMQNTEAIPSKTKEDGWVRINLLININTGEMYAEGGDREPCSHGYPPCCDTKYIGLEWLKSRMIKTNTK